VMESTFGTKTTSFKPDRQDKCGMVEKLAVVNRILLDWQCG
jgi:hypothetical protein